MKTELTNGAKMGYLNVSGFWQLASHRAIGQQIINQKKGVCKMKLKAVRAERMESQWSLSRETGIHQSKISLFERGYITPSKEEKQKIADALNVSVDHIDWDIRRGGKNESKI